MVRGLSGACASVLLLLAAAVPAHASPSVYTVAPDEPRAVTVKGAGDGRADDSAAIQRAIDAAAEKGGGGIVFLPAGTYRISRTIFLWPGVRIFGIGERRPVILLGRNTPGFQRGVAHMLMFTGSKRQTDRDTPPAAFPPAGSVPFNRTIADAIPAPSILRSAISTSASWTAIRRPPRSASTPPSTASSAMPISTSLGPRRPLPCGE